MPEGPETRRMADSLSRVVKRKKITSSKFLHPAVDSLNGDSTILVDDVTSVGKSIIIRLSTGYSIITHNQLYGKWSIHLLKTRIKHNRKLRIEFVSGKKVARLYSATDIVLLKSKDESKHHYLKNLGPDILDDKIDERIVFDRLISKPFNNRNLGGLLLNQHFIAGLGNYLRSEILFFSGLMPFTKPKDLNDTELSNLSHSIKRVSLRAYYQHGSTIDREELSKRFGNVDNFKLIKHMVFNRKDQPCFYCGNTIQKNFQSSRRLYYCIECQA